MSSTERRISFEIAHAITGSMIPAAAVMGLILEAVAPHPSFMRAVVAGVGGIASYMYSRKIAEVAENRGIDVTGDLLIKRLTEEEPAQRQVKPDSSMGDWLSGRARH